MLVLLYFEVNLRVESRPGMQGTGHLKILRSCLCQARESAPCEARRGGGCLTILIVLYLFPAPGTFWGAAQHRNIGIPISRKTGSPANHPQSLPITSQSLRKITTKGSTKRPRKTKEAQTWTKTCRKNVKKNESNRRLKFSL